VADENKFFNEVVTGELKDWVINWTKIGIQQTRRGVISEVNTFVNLWKKGK